MTTAAAVPKACYVWDPVTGRYVVVSVGRGYDGHLYLIMPTATFSMKADVFSRADLMVGCAT